MSRQPDVKLAGGSAVLTGRCRVERVAPLLHTGLADGADVIIEGTQGFSLSLYHGPGYPFVTSRDTTAAGFAAEVGLSPRDIDNIVMVIRTFPIRVGGPSGTLSRETTWDAIAAASGAPSVVLEYTSVTKRLRRVAEFDSAAVKLACAYNRPTSLAVMGVDRIDYINTAVKERSELTQRTRQFLENLELTTAVPISIIGTGFQTTDAICLSIGVPADELCNV
jgi:adenylosuccinate synthase